MVWDLSLASAWACSPLARVREAEALVRARVEGKRIKTAMRKFGVPALPGRIWVRNAKHPKTYE